MRQAPVAAQRRIPRGVAVPRVLQKQQRLWLVTAARQREGSLQGRHRQCAGHGLVRSELWQRNVARLGCPCCWCRGICKLALTIYPP